MAVDLRIPRDLRGEIGRSGVLALGGYVYEEALRELQLWNGQRIYREMADGNAIIGGVLLAIEQIVRKAEWTVEPAGKDQDQEDAAQFVDEALGDMAVTWQDTLSEILSLLIFGWSWCEQVYKYRDGDGDDPGRASKYDDGKIGWASWSIRAQETLLRWEFDEAGALLGLWQLPPPDYRLRFIPIDKSLHFKTTSRKGNPEGLSLLRRCYQSWYFEQNIQRIEAIGIERDLAGLPVAKIPGTVMTSPDLAAEYQAYKDLVSNLRNDEQAGVVIPSDVDPDSKVPLYSLELLSTGGSRQIQVDPVIARYDRRIAGALLADFMLLGQDKVGSFALSHDKTALFQQAVSSLLDNIESVVNRFAIPRLLRLNGMPIDRGTPALRHGEVTTPDLAKLGAYVQALATAKLNVAGIADGKWLLEQAGIPTLATLSGPDDPDTQSPAEQQAAAAQAKAQQQPVPTLGAPGEDDGDDSDGNNGDQKSRAAAEPEDGSGEWRTIHGDHVFIRDGESVDDAIARQKAGKGGSDGAADAFKADFATEKQAIDWWRDSYGFPRMNAIATADERRAVEDYSNWGYSAINAQARAWGRSRDAGTEPAMPVRNLRSLMDKEGGIPRNLVVYRGLSGGAVSAVEDVPVGATFVDHGFVSTTLKKSYSGKWADGAVATIEVPSGTLGIGWCGKDDEKEITLANSLRYQVIAKKRTSGTLHLRLRVVGKDHWPYEPTRKSAAETLSAANGAKRDRADRFLWQDGDLEPVGKDHDDKERSDG